MQHQDVLTQVRNLVGNPTREAVADRQFLPFLDHALEILAQELKFALREDDVSLAVVAGQQTYSLPPEVNTVQWISYGNRKLIPRTTYEWDRSGTRGGAGGGNYRTAQPGIPAEYAVEGRTIILNVPPDAGTAAAYPALLLKAVVDGFGFNLPGAGIPDLPDADARLLAEIAAQRYCASNPDEKGLNAQRAQSLQVFLARDMTLAKSRHGQTVEDNQPRFGVATPRWGGSR